MTWLGWLLLLALLYPVILIVQGIVQFVLWLAERLLPEPSKEHHPHEKPARPQGPKPAPVPNAPQLTGPSQAVAVAAAQAPVHPRRPSRLRAAFKSLRMLLVWKDYDYWVACALAEEDPARKIGYLTKALALQPDYLPAWGLKGNALFAQEQYEPALHCFEKTCDAHPSPMTWYRMGVCCHHLNRRTESLRYLQKALDTCPPNNQHLRDEALRMKSLEEYLAEPRGAK